MRIWSKADFAGFALTIFGIICFIFSNTSFMTSICLMLASSLLMYGIYNARYDFFKYESMLCHYQSILSTSNDSWIAWNLNNEFIGASKKTRTILSIQSNKDISIKEFLSSIHDENIKELSLNLNKLKHAGTGFTQTVTTKENNTKIEIHGSRMSIKGIDTMVLWCSNITTTSMIVSNIEKKLEHEKNRTNTLSRILDELPIPIWERNENLAIEYCNQTYAKFLDIPVNKIKHDNIPLIPGSLFGQGHSLAENAKKCKRQQNISQFIVINGVRKKISIYENPMDDGRFIGYAIDATEEENLANKLDRVIVANCEVLENLSTAIAIFGENTRLTFFNSSYQKMMKLESGWLHSKPTFAEILSECRDNRQLPEHADFQAFKKSQLDLFTSVTVPIQQLMHLPNGKTLRLVIAPYPLGGLLFMYEDVTYSLSLQRKNSTLLAVQKETIDHLYEGVMVYGSDNRLKIVNNSMLKIWNLEENGENSLKGIHISEMLDLIKGSLDFGDNWQTFKENAISNLTDRITKTGKLLKKDNSVILFSYIPLPDGAHMHSFIDITDTCVVERAIMEKNQALKTAQKLRFEFVNSISTELKDPLNVLIGFAELLVHQYYGALNDKQFEYCSCILSASNQLHQLINNLLEMVSVDLESVELDLTLFKIEDAINEVISNLEKRAKEKNVDMILHYANQETWFNGDKIRIKQAVFNIIIHAIQFAPPNGKVEIRVVNENNKVKIIIKDNGIGREPNKKAKVFSRSNTVNFMSSDTNTISMPLVRSLIELHGGTLQISSKISEGTSVICSLPITPAEVNLNEKVTDNDFTEVKDVVNY